MLVRRREFIIATAGLIATGIDAQRFAAAASGSFTCRAFIDQRLSLDSEFELTALIEWVSGDGRIFLPLTWGLRGFRVYVADARGTSYDPPINNFHPGPPQAVDDERNFLHMFPGMVVGDKLRMHASAFFRGRGNFTIFVSYISPVPRDFTRVANAVVTEDGPVNAPVVRVRVI